jgi:hypothetical protein
VLVRQLGAEPEVSSEEPKGDPKDDASPSPGAGPSTDAVAADAVGTGVFGRAPDAETAP